MWLQSVRGTSGVVASGHSLASLEGISVLRDGGNAIDAAVAAGAVLSVTRPAACGMGGDTFMIIYDAASRSLHGLNGSGASPAATTFDQFSGEMPRHGMLLSSVPGMLGGWQAALERFGTRSLNQLIEPAIRYAADGFVVSAKQGRGFAVSAPFLEQDDGARQVLMAGGRTPRGGEVLRQPDLARSLQLIAEQGIGAFYGGEIAEKIAAYSATHGGRFSVDDFARHQVRWQQPMAAPFYGHSVVTMPPNSYGLTLLLQLVELEAGNIAACDPQGTEVWQRGMAARVNAYAEAVDVIAEPALVEDAARALLEKALAKRSGGATDGGNPGKARPASGGSDTSNVLVMDRHGNAVSLIQSVFHYFGSCVAPAGTGIVLNNRMLGFCLDADHPNALGPGKYPAHTLTPVMVTRDGAPRMVCGTPGGPGQTATLSQLLTRVLAFGQGVDEAISLPRWSAAMDGSFVVEDGLAEDVISKLQASNPDLKVAPMGGQPFGSLKAIIHDGTAFFGVADLRREANVCGW